MVPTPRRSHAGETVKEKQPAAGATNTGADLKTLQDVWESLRAFLLALGDDVADEGAGAIRRVPAAEELRLCQAAQKDLQVWTKLDPSSVPLEAGFTRDVSQIGHAGTGDLEIRIQTAADLERAQPLLLRSYQGA